MTNLLLYVVCYLFSSSVAFDLRQTTSRFTLSPRHLALQPLKAAVAEVEEVDVVVVGSGLGGLCCGALLASRGYQVIRCIALS
jgi:predicted esterase YcpF (UPF0227 family)